MDSLPTVLLKPGEADRIAAGHPWVYHSSILRLSAQPPDGELVQVKDHRQRFLGIGFFNSKSKIHVRVLAPERTLADLLELTCVLVQELRRHAVVLHGFGLAHAAIPMRRSDRGRSGLRVLSDRERHLDVPDQIFDIDWLDQAGDRAVRLGRRAQIPRL